MTSSVILESLSNVRPNSVHEDECTHLARGVKASARVSERENKRAKVQKKSEDARGWDDTDACLSRVGNKFRGSCLAHSFPMAQ